MDMPTNDELVRKVRRAWDRHSKALRTEPRDDIEVRRAFIEVLRAERNVEQDCLESCTQAPTRELYKQTVAEYDAQIADEERALELMMS
jgi:hypothetical protein